MKIDKATEYQLAALKSARFYNEGGKYKVSVDLSVLPGDIMWDIAVIVEKPNGGDLFVTYTKNTHNVKGLTNLNQLGVATLSVRVSNTKMQFMLSHKISISKS